MLRKLAVLSPLSLLMNLSTLCTRPVRMLFAVERQLAAHASKVHGVGTKWRFYAGVSNTSCGCRLKFATRSKLLAHLHNRSPYGWDIIVSHFRPLELDQVIALDSAAAERMRSCRSAPRDYARCLPIRVREARICFFSMKQL